MQLIDLTLATPEENLALDEALLDAAEAGEAADEVLRLWESPQPIVVVGRSSRVEDEVDGDYCRATRIPVLRRCSGGAAVVAGPGCLMYAVVLGLARRPALRAVDHAHREVLGRIAAALAPLAPRVACRGTSDLVLESAAAAAACAGSGGSATASPVRCPEAAETAAVKFSGNSIRSKRGHLLYHGTLLYDFPLEQIERCLAMPPRQPAYRGGRPHGQFLANLPLPAAILRHVLATAFAATEPATSWPEQRTAQLVAARYGRRQWNA